MSPQNLHALACKPTFMDLVVGISVFRSNHCTISITYPLQGCATSESRGGNRSSHWQKVLHESARLRLILVHRWCAYKTKSKLRSSSTLGACPSERGGAISASSLLCIYWQGTTMPTVRPVLEEPRESLRFLWSHAQLWLNAEQGIFRGCGLPREGSNSRSWR